MRDEYAQRPVQPSIPLALVGNPNVGKSSIFNYLTGENQPIGNWPGKTVARFEGTFTAGSYAFRVVDLPGTYSLSAYSPEEQITRQYLLDTRPWLVINVVDAANLERNLYLTAQLLEMEMPLLLVLNMMDVAERRGIRLDTAVLREELGVPVFKASARQASTLNGIETAILRAMSQFELTEAFS